MAVAGSNGVDQTLDYQLTLSIPRAALGAEADRAVQSLISKAGRTGLDLRAADSVHVRVGLAGTVTNPSVQTDFQGLVRAAGDRAREIVSDAVVQRVEEVEARVDPPSTTLDEAPGPGRTAWSRRRRRKRPRSGPKRPGWPRTSDRKRAAASTNSSSRPGSRGTDGGEGRGRSDPQGGGRPGQCPVAEADRRAEALVAEARRRADELLGGG